MTNRTLTLSHQTRLAVNIVIEDDTGTLAFCLFFATGLFALCSKISRFVLSVGHELSMLAGDLRQAIEFTDKVFSIVFVSLTFGLGVTI